LLVLQPAVFYALFKPNKRLMETLIAAEFTAADEAACVL
jgi:hypothetical protein